MTTYTQCKEASPVPGRIAAVLTVAVLTVLFAGCVPETPPSPSPVAWIEMDSGGGRNVYYLKDGKPVHAGRLTGPVPSPGTGTGTGYTMMSSQQMMPCIWTPFGIFC